MGGRGSCRSYLHEATIAADDKIASSDSANYGDHAHGPGALGAHATYLGLGAIFLATQVALPRLIRRGLP